MQNRRKRKKSRLISAVSIAVTAAAAGALIWLFLRSGSNVRTENNQAGGDSSSPDGVWQGRGYNHNDHLSNFLFIGVDNRRKKLQIQEARTPDRQTLFILFPGTEWTEI